MSYENVKIKKEKIQQDKKIEKSNKRRKLVIFEIMIGIALIALIIIMNYSQQYLKMYYQEKNSLGLISNSVYNNYLYQLSVNVINLKVFWILAGFVTIIGLILGAVSPLGGKGTPYFSEYVRLGLLVGAGVVLFAIFSLTDTIFITW